MQFKHLLLLTVWHVAMAPVMAATHLPDAPPARAHSPIYFGQYAVHFSAFNSTFISPTITSAYNLARGPRTGIVNIAIRNRQSTNVASKAVTGCITGSAINLLGQRAPLRFQEVREDKAIYYLASFRFHDTERLRFELAVTPTAAPGNKTLSQQLKFSQSFYQDP